MPLTGSYHGFDVLNDPRERDVLLRPTLGNRRDDLIVVLLELEFFVLQRDVFALLERWGARDGED